MKVLVTGGAGFIGSHIVECLQGTADVRVLDNLRSGYKHNLAGLDHEFIEASICDREAVRRAMEDVDFVFHLAAMISVPESMQKPIDCNEINTRGTLIILEEAARAKIKKLVFSSSAAIYGDNPTTPKIETMLPEPKSPYAITKLDGEYYCKMFTDEGRLATTCLRYFNVFGPRQDPKSKYAAAVPIFIDCAVKNEPITIYGEGDQTRDFVYVKDIAAANIFFAMKSAATGVFNVGYGQRITIRELAATICRIADSRSTLQHAAERPGDVKHSLAAVEKLQAAGFDPRGDFQKGLNATVEFFRDKSQITSAL
jgi:nucleoside-diphosphate-sugar epimerase